MAYEVVTPATLDILDKTTPAGSEDASLLDDSIRQLKSIVMDVILLEHNANGTHKGVAASLDANSVTGDKISSSATNDPDRAIGTNHIKDGSITTAKILDANITLSKLAAASVDNTKITDNTISGAKIQDNTIPSAKLAGLSITGSLLADASVGTSKLIDASVSESKLADGSVSAVKVKLASGRIFVGDANGAGVECQIGGNVTVQLDLTTSPATARFNVKVGESGVIPIAVIEEIGNFSSGYSSNAWFSHPGAGANFNEVSDIGDNFGIQGSHILFRTKGTYFVVGFCNFYGTTVSTAYVHQARLIDVTNSSNIVLLEGSEAAALTPGGSAASALTSHFNGVITVQNDNSQVDLQSLLNNVGGTQFNYQAGSVAFRQVGARLTFIKIA